MKSYGKLAVLFIIKLQAIFFENVSQKSFKYEAPKEITSEEITLMKNCIEFKLNKGIRPQYD